MGALLCRLTLSGAGPVRSREPVRPGLGPSTCRRPPCAPVRLSRLGAAGSWDAVLRRCGSPGLTAARSCSTLSRDRLRPFGFVDTMESTDVTTAGGALCAPTDGWSLVDGEFPRVTPRPPALGVHCGASAAPVLVARAGLAGHCCGRCSRPLLLWSLHRLSRFSRTTPASPSSRL